MNCIYYLRVLRVLPVAFLLGISSAAGYSGGKVNNLLLPGGRMPANENDSKFWDFAWKGATEVNKMSNSLHHFVPIRVAKVQKQVVSGVMYHMQVVYGQSSCKANRVRIEEVTAARCPLKTDMPGVYQKCYLTVWQQPWRKMEKVKNKGCKPSSKKEALGNKKRNKHTVTMGRELLMKSDERVQKLQKSQLKYFSTKDKYAWVAFNEFLERFNKKYTGGSRELRRRFRTFTKNLNIIQQLQANEKGTAKYGVTKFADMSPREFKRIILTPDWQDIGYPTTYAEIPTGTVPDSWDWREHNAVSNVKNQGFCGSCWAFSATGNIEGQWAIKKGRLLSLSEQELVDCDKLDQGCNGGYPSNAYREILRLGGLETEKEYPYDGRGQKDLIHITPSLFSKVEEI